MSVIGGAVGFFFRPEPSRLPPRPIFFDAVTI
jgi:hypothetical protein